MARATHRTRDPTNRRYPRLRSNTIPQRPTRAMQTNPHDHIRIRTLYNITCRTEHITCRTTGRSDKCQCFRVKFAEARNHRGQLSMFEILTEGPASLFDLYMRDTFCIIDRYDQPKEEWGLDTARISGYGQCCTIWWTSKLKNLKLIPIHDHIAVVVKFRSNYLIEWAPIPSQIFLPNLRVRLRLSAFFVYRDTREKYLDI